MLFKEFWGDEGVALKTALMAGFYANLLRRRRPLPSPAKKGLGLMTSKSTLKTTYSTNSLHQNYFR